MNLLENDVIESPSEAWDQDASKKGLDDIFSNDTKYVSRDSHHELLQFIARSHRI